MPLHTSAHICTHLHSIPHRPVRGWRLVPSPFHPEPVVSLVLSCKSGAGWEQRSADLYEDGLPGPVNVTPKGWGPPDLVEIVGGQGRRKAGVWRELGNAEAATAARRSFSLGAAS